MEKSELVAMENEVPSDLVIPLKQIIENTRYVAYKVEKRSMSSNNNNYLGLLYEIDIKGTTKDGDDKEINIFAKCIPGNKFLGLLSESDVYKTELFAYKQLLPIFEEMQAEACVPIAERFKTVGFYQESTSEAIIMENMIIKGFQTYYRMDVPSLQFLKLSIQELAKFHALSFALKEKRPEFFDKKIKTLKNPIIFEAEWPSFVNTVKNLVAPFIDEEYIERVMQEYDNLVNKFPMYYNNENTTACICHGDYRPNNTLTKLEVNGAVQEIITIDYQVIHYASPINDLLYFIYCSTDRDCRKAHMSDLKDLYYDTFSNFLRALHVDPESVYNEKEFEKAYKQNLSYGLAVSLLFKNFMFVPENGIADFDNIKFETDDRFKGRLREIIEEYIEWGYL